MFQKLKVLNEKLWAWCKESGTILWARLQTISGFLLAALAGMDWSPLVGLGSSTGFTIHQLISLGLILLANGIVTEVIRRRKNSNDPV